MDTGRVTRRRSDKTAARGPAPAASGPTAEHRRLAGASLEAPGPWAFVGPYLAERAWGTVREDYSANATAWEYFPHDHARSRAYRWNEDGLAGICDLGQRLCLALAFWNGRDPILKERLFGLTGNEGNHGEDVKEYWWYVDATPTSSWLRWRYHYPQAEFPYDRLVQENKRRGRADREYELVDTQVFDGDAYWQIAADYAKATPDDVCLRLRIRNAAPEMAELHVLPTLWFRNVWSWERGTTRPALRAVRRIEPDAPAIIVAEDVQVGRWILGAGHGPAGHPPDLLFCENETNAPRLFGSAPETPYPKDGINDHVVHGAATVNPALEGTKASCWYRVAVAAGDTVEIRLRLHRVPDGGADGVDLGAGFEQVMAERERDADDFHASLCPQDATRDECAVMRAAFAGLVWSQQFYHYDVARWLDGDPAQPAPPPARKSGRNAAWRHLDNCDIVLMPDKWEYPWYAAWDLAFHCVTLAHMNPAAAKHQLRLVCREWYMHPNGQLPAYEWAFSDVNPPVHAWAALSVFLIDGGTDFDFLSRVFQKLLMNFTWWVNRKDALDNNIFEGGFLGLDNIGPIDRSTMLPAGFVLEQSDGTAWMAMYCLNMLEIALHLANHDRTYEDVAVKFFEHFAYIAAAMAQGGLWDEQEGFFYDLLRMPGGGVVPMRGRSMVGLVPIFASVTLPITLWERLTDFAARVRWFTEHKPELAGGWHAVVKEGQGVVTLVDQPRLRRIIAAMLDEQEFLSPYGLRSLSRYHREHPLVLKLPGAEARLDYEPAESSSGLFGGNSNWRGPIWFPLNFLAIEALRQLHAGFGDEFTVELPTRSGRFAHLGEVADEIERRLLRLFLPDQNGRRPFWGTNPRFQDAAWRDHLLFHEYFHGETGEGLGASHQSGWTALAAALIVARARPRQRVCDVR